MASYYHYTDRDSAKQIMESGKILQSQTRYGDAVAGDGTYFTKIGPDAGRSAVARNNYDGTNAWYWEDKVRSGKADVAIEVKFQKGKIEDHSEALGRDVHKYPGDVSLARRNVKVHVRNDAGYSTYEVNNRRK